MAKPNKSKGKTVKITVQKGKKKQKGKTGKSSRRGKGLMPLLGAMAGSAMGGPAGGEAGLLAGKLVSSITGFGDYKVNSNTLIQGNSVATFRQGGDGMRVTHREFLYDIVGSVSFSLQTLPLNPGMGQTFPWLSLVSQNFEEYEMNGLVFEFRPSSGSAVSASSSALGVVIFATDYDAANPSFTNKQAMESYEFSTSTVPFKGCMHPVECARQRNVLDNLYTRVTDPPTGTDIRLYDMGNFQYATQGMQSAYQIGELWVTYDCTLRKPRLPAEMSSFAAGNVLHLVEQPATESKVGSFFGSTGPLKNGDTTMPDSEWSPNGHVGFKLHRAGWYQMVTSCYVAVTPGNVNITTGANVVLGPTVYYQNSVAFINVGAVATSSVTNDIRTIVVLEDGTGAANVVNFDYSVGETGANCDIIVTLISHGLPLWLNDFLRNRDLVGVNTRAKGDLRPFLAIPTSVQVQPKDGERKEEFVKV